MQYMHAKHNTRAADRKNKIVHPGFRRWCAHPSPGEKTSINKEEKTLDRF